MSLYEFYTNHRESDRVPLLGQAYWDTSFQPWKFSPILGCIYWYYTFRRWPGNADRIYNISCCGGVREFIPDLIEAGLDAINPVQANCSGIDPAELKMEFGKDLMIWGCACDTREVLPFSTPDSVRQHVKEQVRIFSPAGGLLIQWRLLLQLKSKHSFFVIVV